jgi:hypothetical protein
MIGRGVQARCGSRGDAQISDVNMYSYDSFRLVQAPSKDAGDARVKHPSPNADRRREREDPQYSFGQVKQLIGSMMTYRQWSCLFDFQPRADSHAFLFAPTRGPQKRPRLYHSLSPVSPDVVTPCRIKGRSFCNPCFFIMRSTFQNHCLVRSMALCI